MLSTPTVEITENSVPVTGEYFIDPNNYGRRYGVCKPGVTMLELFSVQMAVKMTLYLKLKMHKLNSQAVTLVVELVPEPNLPPGIEREVGDMNPKPASRRDKSDGSISVRISNEFRCGCILRITVISRWWKS